MATKLKRVLSTKEIERTLVNAREQLVRLGKTMPDEDCYAMAYSTAALLVETIDANVKDLGKHLKEAAADLKKNPVQSDNRAKKWCRLR